MSPAEALTYLDSFINLERRLSEVKPSELKLGRMRRLLERLDHPQRGMTFLHVAGSKGKGTTSVFAASILQSAGYRTGLYTSPHLFRINERLRVLGPAGPFMPDDPFAGSITDDELARLVAACRPVLEDARADEEWGRVTYFEVLTALALVFFRERQVTHAVLETGLGGRLDATNTVDTAVCGITSLGLEHTKILGDTFEKIAAEKAAIIKSDLQRAVSAPQLPGAAEVIAERCAQFSVPLWRVGREISWAVLARDLDGIELAITTPRQRYEQLRVALSGDCYARNAAVAVGMIGHLIDAGHPVSDGAVAEGLQRARIPGRFEIMRRHPYVILDGAHTPDACEELIRNLGGVLPLRRVILVLGVSDDKDAAGMAQRLNLIAQDVILTRSAHPRAAHLTRESMAEFFPDKNILVAGHAKAALRQALQRATPEDVVLVTGSLFLVAEVRAHLQNSVND